MMVRFDFPRTLESLFDESSVSERVAARRTAPPMDISEHENEYVVVAELPGVKKEELKITFENDILTVQAERKPYELPQEARVLLNEMQVREFARSVRLPVRIDVEHIAAELQNGVLRISLPKAQEARPRMISVK
jgi:HSP20 family protein